VAAEAVISNHCLKNVSSENHPFVAPAKETRRAFRQPHVAQATINVQWVQVVLNSRAHKILNVADWRPVAQNGTQESLRLSQQQTISQIQNSTPHHESMNLGKHEKGLFDITSSSFVSPSLRVFMMRGSAFLFDYLNLNSKSKRAEPWNEC